MEPVRRIYLPGSEFHRIGGAVCRVQEETLPGLSI